MKNVNTFFKKYKYCIIVLISYVVLIYFLMYFHFSIAFSLFMAYDMYRFVLLFVHNASNQKN